MYKRIFGDNKEIEKKLNKFQSIVNSINDYICIIRTKIVKLSQDVKDIKFLIKTRGNIEKDKKDKKYYFYESESDEESL
tara:strand:- start:279 stop:515 length:237 start_codon:yes stop_codon:yes gene_type:complete